MTHNTTFRGKLTAEFVKANHIYFVPKTAAEARYIMRRLFAMGVKWKDGSTEVKHVEKVLDIGMNVDHAGTLYTGEDKEKPYIRAAASHFKGHTPREMLTVEERIDILESKLDRVLAILEPQVANKPPLVSKKQVRTP